MAAMQVEGQVLPTEEFTEDLGWRTVPSRKSRALTKPGLGDDGSQGEMAERRGAGERRKGLVIKQRIMKASRMPPMPEEHIKIVIRPRGGLNLEKVSPTTVGRAIVEAAGLTTEQTTEDVICPNFMQNILVARCGARNPEEDHNCEPCCKLCGGRHLTADKQCRQRYQVPYVVRVRRQERARAELAAEQEAAEAAQLASPVKVEAAVIVWDSSPRSRSVSIGGGGGAAGGRATWADKVKGSINTGRTREQSQEHVSGNRDKDRIAQLEKENHSLKAAIEGLVKEIAELKRSLQSANSGSSGQGSKPDGPVEVPRSVEVAKENMADEETPAPKKRALSSTVRVQAKVGSELKEMMAALQESVNQVINRLERIEERENRAGPRVPRERGGRVTCAGESTSFGGKGRQADAHPRACWQAAPRERVSIGDILQCNDSATDKQKTTLALGVARAFREHARSHRAAMRRDACHELGLPESTGLLRPVEGADWISSRPALFRRPTRFTTIEKPDNKEAAMDGGAHTLRVHVAP
ncbi:hypothetical protein HPB52_016175 [Rhipicephalus sanguineus]|uniref:Uncharacterized protein n=1 Tax=Rhipicephalus sanguineus TaxID=34632 RepID=A0A9D4SYP3_RHISA|nr:hypothetical protein HPB52_016175 [Rhipicephalus sanguineus]